MRNIVVAATQMSCTWNIDQNIAKAEKLVTEAANTGANIVLLQELFETPYFCQEMNDEYNKYATEPETNKAIQHFQKIAKSLNVVLPISFFEKTPAGNFNSVAVIDADGIILGIYRKTHIPSGSGYEETYYFKPGDSGFKVWKTKYATIGVGICWDQWFSEAARCMSLLGAELILYPTAIGSEPEHPEIDSKNHWQLVMQGHAAANITPVIASNRVGIEQFGNSKINFYGSSLITNEIGEKIAEADRTSEKVILAELDLERIAKYRDFWGIHKGRRPEMYHKIIEQ
ncbi:MAG TPA: N-carbamoylputrescine amidase [Bacillota bacterium]|jgi:N-carbamoylputrescine amidase|nr:N-carbamoylputrescine amidase [Bacillota bacterium]HOL09393.1 N-carbamoylputrescine amidase [Bacillota bacterium]HPO97117.1 N-carbamoylputrescine amidase [Bacillota bacterium]